MWVLDLKEVVGVPSQSELRNVARPRNEAALEEIRRLFARYRAQPRQPDQRAERHDVEASRRERDADRPAVTGAP
jgi:hypothetical protein